MGTGTGHDRFHILGTGTTHIGSGSGTGGSEAVPVPKADTRYPCSPLIMCIGFSTLPREDHLWHMRTTNILTKSPICTDLEFWISIGYILLLQK